MSTRRKNGIVFTTLIVLLFILSTTAFASSEELYKDIPAVPVFVHVTGDNATLYSRAPQVSVNDCAAEYVSDGTFVCYLPSYFLNDTVTACVTYRDHTFTNSTSISGLGQADLYIDLPSTIIDHNVTGSVFAMGDGGRFPWLDGHTSVYVNGMLAEKNGTSYSAIIRAINIGDILNVKVVHDCGYVLGETSVLMGPDPMTVDVDVRCLNVSGDIYLDGCPAEGSVLLIYDNDRPWGPIEAYLHMDDRGNASGPMFSVNIPGGHPGDHIVITSSLGDRKGISSQDAVDYDVFLTVNLKDIDVYMPYI